MPEYSRLSLVIIFCLFSINIRAANLTFEGQSFGTQTWTENGITWTFTGAADIRDNTSAHGGDNSGAPRNNTELQANHIISINSLWLYIDDFNNDNSVLTIEGYNSINLLVSTKTISNQDDFDFVSISLSGFTNIYRLKFTWNGTPIVRIDDVVYTDGGVLPVELSSFSTFVYNNKIELKWNTTSEINNYGFDVERQLVNNHNEVWEKIGFVKGNGSSNSIKEYSFVDDKPLQGKIFYRLKQIDIDGQYEYSKKIETEVNASSLSFNLAQNYPNPFNPETVIEFTVPEGGQTSLKIYNGIGEEVAVLFNEFAETEKYQKINFNAASLPSGTYFAKLQSGINQMIKKMLIIK